MMVTGILSVQSEAITRVKRPPVVIARVLAMAIAAAATVSVPPVQAARRPAPPFTLTLLDGKTLRLADLKGSSVILLFWAPWCPTCNAEAASWEREYREWQGKGVSLVGIGLLDNRAAVERFMRQYHLTFPTGYDADGSIAKAYGFTVQPFWAWIAPDGTLLRAAYGPADGEELDAAFHTLSGR